ncbi:AraC family transcriptional regulator [Paenibacillus sp. FSL H8-0548]|uniref:AraC family transcriptional regulator n=1 Tax=Paenibacillus sp. FSL H8-0548 TaxID=1920422 RepID=UPI00096E4F79|nr:helix-turn-helix domain-containing protein [Paenibacillus sp. FSL H8-0548]OMF38672.1 AraC family transcriptional regulator [Paenibacillus sp. FSL H8-0548]
MLKKADGFNSEKIIVLPHYQLNEIVDHPIISQLYITDIGYYPRATNHFRERPDGCDSYIFIYCASGQGWIEIDKQERFSVMEQSFAFIPADTPHAYGADENNPWSIYWFHLKGSQVAELMESYGPYDGPLQLALSDAEKILELFHQCYDLLSSKAYSAAHQIHISHTMRYMLSFIGLIPRRKQEEKTLAYIEQAILYMQERLEMNLTLESLVAYTNISKQHLNHLFKQATGSAPIDYYLRLKMQRACQLLDLTDKSIKEISLSVGLSDPYYFSRLFKKIIGASPSEYRSKLKG